MTGKDDRYRILIVDDNRSIHTDFQKILTRRNHTALAEDEATLFGDTNGSSTELNYELDSAFQGQGALALVRQSLEEGRPYDLAFIDMRMPPGWDGLETIERLWTDDPQLQVVICTAYSDYSWDDMASRLGHSDQLLILKKPFDNSEVLQIAASLCTKRRLSERAALRLEELEALVDDRTRVLKQAHEETERLLSAISSLLIGIDPEGVICRWNTTAERIFNIPADRALGCHFSALEIDWCQIEEVAELLKRGPWMPERRVRIAFRDPQGDSRVLGLSVYSVPTQGGVLLLGNDITEHCQLEEQLSRAQKLEAVGQLAAGVAHEINTPMQYLGDNTEYLNSAFARISPLLDHFHRLSQQDVPEAAFVEAAKDIQNVLKSLSWPSIAKNIPEALTDSADGIQHVSRIVRALKEFSHPGQEEKTQADVNGLIHSTIAVSTNEWKYVARIETELNDDLPLIPALPGELSQVFLNLLVNAAHAIDAARETERSMGVIHIASRKRDQCVEVSISDSGPGIPDSIKDRVFDPFFTTKGVGKGTGQGLAIAHSVVVNKHGGRIWFESAPKQGTTFFVQLPIEATADQHSETESELVASS